MFDGGNKKSALIGTFLCGLLQMFNEEIGDAGQQMLGSVSTIDAVVAVGVDVHVELLVGLNEGFAIFRSIAQMHIVVSGTMYQEEFAMELVYPVHGR